jgi:hypothetical protein
VTSRALRRALQAGVAALLLAALYLLRTRAGAAPESAEPAVPRGSSSAPPAAPLPLPHATPVTEAFRSHRSNVELETGGRVLRVLPDDREGSPHERFIVRVEGGPSVLVAHNLDLAPRVPVAPGDSIELRGEYEWNPRGGVIHWTHRDPGGRHAAGWIRHGGRLYQ